jgi:hypothetical protein
LPRVRLGPQLSRLGQIRVRIALFLDGAEVWAKPRHFRLPEEGRNRLTAAMMAGVVDTLMSVGNLFDAVMGGGYSMAA